MADWYDKASEMLIADIAEETELSEEVVQKVYSALVNLGYIDYDIEKELLWDQYCSDDEED